MHFLNISEKNNQGIYLADISVFLFNCKQYQRFKFGWSNSSEVGEQKHIHLAQTIVYIISPKRPVDLTIQADSEGFHRIIHVRNNFFCIRMKNQNSKYISRTRFPLKDEEKTEVALFISFFKASIFFKKFF